VHLGQSYPSRSTSYRFSFSPTSSMASPILRRA
jgi:hypothetical protein